MSSDQSLRDFNTALRQHSEALGRLAQRLRSAEERNQQSFTSQEQLLSRIEKLENFVVRSDADRRRNEDTALQQLNQVRQRVEELSQNVNRNTRLSQELGQNVAVLSEKTSNSSPKLETSSISFLKKSYYPTISNLKNNYEWTK